MKSKGVSDIIVTPKEFFYHVVDEAFGRVKFAASDLSRFYLVELLEKFLHSNQLYDQKDINGHNTQSTLAELFLQATTDERGLRIDLLKKLGDTSLYISGFFGDSLNRKLVDIDYYIEMGGTAYSSLAAAIPDETYQMVYSEYSKKFLGFVDVLTYISQKTQVQNNENLLRLYDRYLKTGSPVAKEQLLEQGIVVDEDRTKKRVMQ